MDFTASASFSPARFIVNSLLMLRGRSGAVWARGGDPAAGTPGWIARKVRPRHPQGAMRSYCAICTM